MSEVGEGGQAGVPQHAGRLGMRLLLVKSLFLVLLAVAGALLARVPWLREWLAPAGAMAERMGAWGWRAWPVFILGTGLLITLGVPRLLFCPLAGAVFGFWGGLLASTVATMGAYFGTFLFLRGRLADREEPLELPPRLAFLQHDPGMAGVILTRLLPIPGLLGTLGLSLSPVRRRFFFWGSLIGLQPEAAPLVMLGAGMLNGSPRHLAWMGAGVLVLVLGSVFLMRRLLMARGAGTDRAGAGGSGRG